jgi:hypothetical protein
MWAAERKKFFNESENSKINILEKREQPNVRLPAESCKTNVFFGFFFDGTRNNYKVIEEENTKNHSNVARLYDCYPGEGVPGILPVSRNWKDKSARYTNFFKVYIPGVATPFPEVKDSGGGMQGQAGAAVGRYAERRIIWALIQAVNNVHRYLLKIPLINLSEANYLLNVVELNKEARRIVARPLAAHPLGISSDNRSALEEFEKIIRRLHKVAASHWPDPHTGKCTKTNPGIVDWIFISIFGFSRGATEARAFTNWLYSLCQLDARLCNKPEGSLTLGGFRVNFDFLGLFDTVASIGSANTANIFDGHGAWADAEESLRIPVGIKCLHMVAAHELRRSFPVDSIAVGRNPLPSGCEELVVPGVHSDIGGGYCPREQGKGLDVEGADMLSRIPLLLMYKSARLSGVPLKLEVADDETRQKFLLKGEVIDAYNAYIKSCVITKGEIHQIMREQARHQMMWRLVRAISGKAPIHLAANFRRASTFDKNDLFSAAQEFEVEIEKFKSWLMEKGSNFIPTAQSPGFHTGYKSEWEEIATWWGKMAVPSMEVLNFFDEYVHDSRAWFKLRGSDCEDGVINDLKRWAKKKQDVENRERLRRNWVDKGMPARISDGLTSEQRLAADEYVKTGAIPRMVTAGREPFAICQAGYLRYRRVYGGSDSVYIS